MTIYLIVKSLHLVAMVAWFAGLFYLVRLFVYHVEASDRPTSEREILQAQYEVMEDRLFRIIVRPAMLLTWIFGILLIHIQGLDWLKVNAWLHVKLLFVFLLSGYSDYLGKIIKRLKKGDNVMTSYQFRLFNEVPTLFLLAIILLAVFKNLTNFASVFLAILLLGIVLVGFSRIYKRIREKGK